MLILYVALKYDYGKPEQSYSFEHYNFYHSLLHMSHDILYFDFATLIEEHGREWMNRRLLEVAKAEKPDLMFTVLFTDELDPAVIREISENTDTVTLNWFCDDHWRFETYSRYWVPCFNWVITTANSALPKYARLGHTNVIKSQWACNQFLYRKLDLPLERDVTFVGQPHGNRREIIQALRNAGINVQVWGSGWESGRLSQEEMIRVFNQSRINLNLSNASVPKSTAKTWAGNLARRYLSRSFDMVPFGSQVKEIGKTWLAAIRSSMSFPAYIGRPDNFEQPYTEQIKARNFEIPGCGGFLLTGRAENLEDYYEIDKAVVCFDKVDGLIEKIRYYLNREDERAAIAKAGYVRTLQEHTYLSRFDQIFRRIGITRRPFTASVEQRMYPGQTRDVC
jgi:spore maturation protein CgeB